MENPPASFYGLVDIVAKLRSPGGCPWDREQTHESLKRNLLEESYEALEAIDSGSPDKIAEEMGDILVQTVFHAQMASEAGTLYHRRRGGRNKRQAGASPPPCLWGRGKQPMPGRSS